MLQNIYYKDHVISMYQLFNILSVLVLLCYFLHMKSAIIEISSIAKKQASRRRRLLIALSIIGLIACVGYAVLLILNPLFGRWFTYGNANYYGSLTGWIVAFTVIPLAFKSSPFLISDSLTSGLPLSLFVAKLACFCHGCCSGFEMPGSFYFNNNTGRYEFPVQMLESLVALVLFFFIRHYKKKNKLIGSVFPVYLVAYSSTRFVTEFFRADLPNVLGPFDAYQILSLIFALSGVVLLYLLRNYGDKIEKVYSRNARQ